MYMSYLTRGLALGAMTLAMGLTLPGIAEARGVKPRSTMYRQQANRGYYANWPQNRVVAMPQTQIARQQPVVLPSGEIVCQPAQPGQVVQRQAVPQQRTVGRPVIISERVVATDSVKKNDVDDSESAE